MHLYILMNKIFAFKVLNHDAHSLKFAFCITHFAEISTILTDEISRKRYIRKKYSDILLNLIKNEQKIYKYDKRLNKFILEWH
jgi:hypothetical protein